MPTRVRSKCCEWDVESDRHARPVKLLQRACEVELQVRSETITQGNRVVRCNWGAWERVLGLIAYGAWHFP